MKKIFILIVLFALLIKPPAISAAQEAWSFQELHYKRCIQEPADKINAFCPPFTPLHTSSHWEHRVQISLENTTFSPNSFVYIAECLEVGEDIDGNGSADPVCTTGNSQLDKTLFCGDANSPNSAACDRFAFLASHKDVLYSLDKTTDYGQFHVINGVVQRVTPGQISTDATGKPSISAIEWQSYTKMDAKRSYMAIYPYIPPSPTPTPKAVYQKGIGGMQQDIINTFPTSTPTPTPVPVRTAWDPRGRVFDTKTLEPVAIGSIVLKQKNETGTFDAGYATVRNPLIFNPFPLEESGVYIFYVENGEYALEPRVPGYRHLTSNEVDTIHPNARRIYTSELYLSDSLPIIEKGSIEYRDIPLFPLTSQVGTEIKVYSEKEEVNDAGNIVYSGYISHPYAEIDIQVCHTAQNQEQCTDKKTYSYKNGGPDNQGNFSITLDQQQLPVGYYFVRSFRKVDLLTLPLSMRIKQSFTSLIHSLLPIRGAYAAQASPHRAVIDPIPRYLEGFVAHTGANTIVEIHRSGYAIPSYKKAVGADGFISVPSHELPREPYTLVVVSEDGTTSTQRTSEFLASNKEYMASNAIKPYKESQGVSVAVSNTPTPKQANIPEKSETATSTPSLLYILIISLCITILAGVSYYFYLKKRNEELS